MSLEFTGVVRPYKKALELPRGIPVTPSSGEWGPQMGPHYSLDYLSTYCNYWDNEIL